jgi:hypothetical protein
MGKVNVTGLVYCDNPSTPPPRNPSKAVKKLSVLE